ncbi:hypothetical protein Vadar_011227 [Vaccinium darrowii]|uniref:Uncharacterized protein n=1 Tax=Vaccinium darrowii TaxID=229202 RepID=A0ACB7YLD4_9ERIC|nr:hypothetical protein Vadar_011227 [Vaccinium darrowii]
MAWILRAPTGRKPIYSTPEYFTIKLNHGGNLVKEDVVEYYIDGTVNYFDYCDNDRISRIELQAMCKEVGYVEELSLYYKVCGSDGKWAFKNIQTDGDVTNMVQCLSNELLELYSVESVIEQNKFVDVDVTNWVWDCGTFSQDNFTFVDLATHIPSTNEPPVASEPPATSEPPPTSGQNPPPTTRRRRQLNNDSDSGSDSDCEVFIDSDYDLSEDDDALFDANVDTEIEWIGVGQKRVTRTDIPCDCLSEIDFEEGDSSDGFMSCDSSSDEDKEDKPKFRKYRPVVGKVQPIIEEDMVFKNRAQCVEAIRQHAILNGKAITFEKNDTDRVRAHCVAPCPWKILASSITKEDRITLKKATKKMEGSYVEQYGKLWDYCGEMGLINAIMNLLPCVEHRHCVRHLHSNMKRAGHTGQAVKERLWSLARATYMGRFKSIMEEFKKEDDAAFKWLAKHEAHHWSRSHFSEAPKCDMLLNNLCESFNAAILDARDKPIITMLERIRIYLIRHLVKRRTFVEKWHGQIGPKIVKLLDKNIALCKEYVVVITGDNQFEVKGFSGNTFCINMNAQTCSCRRWDLTGIPCAHALAVFRESRKKVEGIVHHYYQKQTYVNTYKHVMYPMNGMDMWEKTDKPPIQPPHYARKSGRPKKCRRREVDEPPPAEDGTKKMKRHLKKLSCRRCGGKGHNVRTCPSGLEAPRSKEKQCSQVITQPTFSQPSQLTPIVTRAPKALTRRGGATKGGAAPRGGAP